MPRADKNQRGPRAAAPGGEKLAYYCWGVGLGSLIAGIVKLIALKKICPGSPIMGGHMLSQKRNTPERTDPNGHCTKETHRREADGVHLPIRFRRPDKLRLGP